MSNHPHRKAVLAAAALGALAVPGSALAASVDAGASVSAHLQADARQDAAAALAEARDGATGAARDRVAAARQELGRAHRIVLDLERRSNGQAQDGAAAARRLVATLDANSARLSQLVAHSRGGLQKAAARGVEAEQAMRSQVVLAGLDAGGRLQATLASSVAAPAGGTPGTVRGLLNRLHGHHVSRPSGHALAEAVARAIALEGQAADRLGRAHAAAASGSDRVRGELASCARKLRQLVRRSGSRHVTVTLPGSGRTTLGGLSADVAGSFGADAGSGSGSAGADAQADGAGASAQAHASIQLGLSD